MSQQLLTYQSYFLVGIKGVAMTSLAACLLDAGKHVLGSDVETEFVTEKQLKQRQLAPISLTAELPANIDCVIYTAAHGGPKQQQVLAAQQKGLPVFSHAEALAALFNQKDGVAVCGVGGKSTISAMLSWIMSKVEPQSYSVGVGEIIGLPSTGQWLAKSRWFIAEADDYVTDPAAPARNEPITPRFSYLKPKLLVCSNLQYDHPDVYRDFEHTKEVFAAFFAQMRTPGSILINGDDQALVELTKKQLPITVGWQKTNNWQLKKLPAAAQKNLAQLTSPDGTTYALAIQIPGEFNLLNAALAVVTAHSMGVDVAQATTALASFASTKRRFEKIGQKNGVTYYDDYAHHPHEVAAAIKALTTWHPQQRVVIGFQSHTYSRTKELFGEFVTALATAQEVVLLDIFASARETADPTVSSDQLVSAVQQASPNTKIENLRTIEAMANWCKTNLQPGDVFITLGAGDIYLVHQKIANQPSHAQKVTTAFPEYKWRINYPLAEQTYFKIGGPAEAYIELDQATDVARLLAFCTKASIPVTLLGGASNVLIDDQGLPGVVIKLVNKTCSVDPQNPQLITAGAGLQTALLVRESMNHGLTGLEFFLGVPGTVGGAIYNNAHYLESLISDHVESVQAITPTGELVVYPSTACEFAYEQSRFQRTQEVIFSVTFKLLPGTAESSQALLTKATRYRAQTQPLGEPSSGCMFQNVPNTARLKALFPQFADRQFVPAGFLIDQAGLKGYQQGNIAVSTKHAAFLVNTGGGKSADVKKVVQHIKQIVAHQFQVDLHEEVFFLGEEKG